MDKTITMHLMIIGRVQGVGFRSWAMLNAVERELIGWVRNLRCGSVEMTISGAQASVTTMIEACWEGPLAARVKNVEAISYKNGKIRPCFIQLDTL